MNLSQGKLEDMLLQWGRDYRLDWVELLGHHSHNVLYDLIRFRGRVPVTGYQPEPIHTESDRIEREVSALYRFHPVAATCLRLLYCGRGTVAEKAELAGDALGDRMSRATFRTMVRMAQMYLWGVLNERKT
jgi:hypothetical protein